MEGVSAVEGGCQGVIRMESRDLRAVRELFESQLGSICAGEAIGEKLETRPRDRRRTAAFLPPSSPSTALPASSPLEIVSALLYATLFLLKEALAVLAGLVKTSSTSSGDSIEASSSSSSSASSAKSLDSSSALGGSMRVMKIYKKVSSSERVREGGEEGGRRKEEEGGRTSRFLDATRSYLVFFGAEALSGELSCYITLPSHQLPPFLRALHENNRHSPAPSQQPP